MGGGRGRGSLGVSLVDDDARALKSTSALTARDWAVVRVLRCRGYGNRVDVVVFDVSAHGLACLG